MNIPEQNPSAREYMIWAILELLETKTFEKISVKEIVKKAGISRSTFYIHFRDKYELMELVRDLITAKLVSFYEKEQKLEEDSIRSVRMITYQICQHIYEYRSFFQHELEKPEYINRLSTELTNKLEQAFDDQTYAIFARFGTIGYLSYWVKGKFQISPTAAAD